jgi:transposase-like protein
MPKPRSKYTDAFKQDAIRLVLEARMPLTEAAAKLGVPNSVLSKWAKQGREASQGTQDANREPNLRQLVKRIERLEGSLEVLRKIVQEDLIGRVKTAFPD